MPKITRRRMLQASAGGATWAAGSEAGLAAPASAVRRDVVFDRGWKFNLGDPAGAHLPDFDDGGWRHLDLPHDWSFEDRPGAPAEAPSWVPPVARWSLTERQRAMPPKDGGPLQLAKAPPEGPGQPPRPIGPFDPTASPMGWGTGWTVGGVGWYRKAFPLTDLLPEEQVELRFDGVYLVSEVWVNGVSVGRNVNGYLGFVCDLTAHLRPDGPNVVAVRVANEGPNARWYSGSGVYRHVWLSRTGMVRIPYGGLAVATRAVQGTQATISISAEVENRARQPRAVVCDIAVRDAKGRVVATASRSASLTAAGTGRIETDLTLPHADLWSPDSPHLYTAEVTLKADGQISDRLAQRFGVRVLSASPEAGFRINGKAYKLRGACLHHDNGLLGAVAIDRAERRKVELLKANGFNAIRTSHNPYSPYFLDVCDELGMVVIGETFDFWQTPKFWMDGPKLYFQDNWRRDLAAIIRRDRNRPSIAFWSIGNEIPEVDSPRGVELAGEMRDIIRSIDPSRLITNALLPTNAGKVGEGARSKLDVVGYNYDYEAVAKDHAAYPQLMFVTTESYAKDARDIWRAVEHSPWYLGDFVWTAMDYLGEVGLGASYLRPGPAPVAPTYDKKAFQWDYPAYQPGCGDLDLLGRKRPPSFYRDVVWGRSKLELFVQRPTPPGTHEVLSNWGWPDELASWAWPGHEGQPMTVRAYTSGDEVRLLLDGREIARQSVGPNDQLRALFQLAFAPGTLTAVAFRGGREIGRKTLATTGAATRLRLTAERDRIGGGAGELAYVFVDVLDAAGRPVADAAVPVRFSVQGAVRLLRAGSANPFGVESFQDARTRTYHGAALAILAPTHPRGEAHVDVSSEGLAGARLTIQVG